MPNAGFPETRSFIAAQLKNSTDLSFTEDHIVMCVGAGGGLNVVFKTVTDPGDEVIVLAPYFMEYRAYVENYHGVLRVVETDSNFRIDFDQLEKHISSKTKAILINSPNNPTGVVTTAMRCKSSENFSIENHGISAEIYFSFPTSPMQEFASIMLKSHLFSTFTITVFS